MPISNGRSHLLIALLFSACADEPLDLAVARGSLDPGGEETVVQDRPQLDLRFDEDAGTVELRFWTGAAWALLSGSLVDVISKDSLIEEVSARFRPEAEHELRMRFPSASGDWEPWSAWTTGRIERRLRVPAAGLELRVDFEAETRSAGSTWRWICYPTGCVKIRTLNSGG